MCKYFDHVRSSVRCIDFQMNPSMQNRLRTIFEWGLVENNKLMNRLIFPTTFNTGLDQYGSDSEEDSSQETSRVQHTSDDDGEDCSDVSFALCLILTF